MSHPVGRIPMCSPTTSVAICTCQPQADSLGKMPEMMASGEDVVKEFQTFCSAYNIPK